MRVDNCRATVLAALGAGKRNALSATYRLNIFQRQMVSTATACDSTLLATCTCMCVPMALIQAYCACLQLEREREIGGSTAWKEDAAADDSDDDLPLSLADVP